MIRGGNRFLEIGPGSFNLTEDLARRFATGTLVEMNPGAQEIFAGLPLSRSQGLELIIGDFMDIDLPAGNDCIVACEVMEHVEDDALFLDRIYGLLSGGGRLILSVPAHRAMWEKDDESVGHVRRYERQDLMDLLSQRKWTDVRIISYGYPFSNLLRLLRIAFTDVLYRKDGSTNRKALSGKSGISPLKGLFSIMGLVMNPYTMYPLCAFASLFNDTDLSDSYLLMADKPRDKGGT